MGDAELTSNAMTERAAAVAIVRRLRERGYTAYLAGGCVRDELLGEEPKDFDVATDARPDDIQSMFKRTASVGAAFGVVLVREFGPTTEVATFRSDGAYSDNRRPDSIAFADASEDAQRRDFTINALFIDPLESGDERVIDLVDGRRDLIARTLRAVGDPDKRLGEDHLRALRAVRFAARYGLSIEPGTAEAIRRHASQLSGVSKERIGGELRRMLGHPTRARAGQLLHDLQLARAVFGCVREYRPGVLEQLGDHASFIAALMALLIERGYRPGSKPDDEIRRARGALLLSNDERADLREGFRVLGLLLKDWWGELGEAGRKRLAAGPGYRDAVAVLGAIDPALAGEIRQETERLASRFGGLAPEPLITGEHLIALGMSPGPGFKVLLDAVYDAQLEGKIASSAEGEVLARSLSGG